MADKHQRSLRHLIADPGALGLYAFAVTTFLAGTIHCQWKTNNNTALFAPAFAYGGIAQAIAGIFDLVRGEKVSGSTFVAFGFYWVTQALWSWPTIRLNESYENAAALSSIKGFYAVAWSAVAFGTWLAMLQHTWMHIILLTMVTWDFLAIGIVNLHPNATFEKVVGYFLVVTSATAWYVGTSLLVKDNSPVKLPLFPVKKASQESSRNYESAMLE